MFSLPFVYSWKGSTPFHCFLVPGFTLTTSCPLLLLPSAQSQKKDIQVFLTWTFSPPASFLLPFSPALFRTSALLWGDPVSLLYSPLSFLSFLYHNFILSRRYHILCGLQQKWGESLTSWWGSRRFGFLFALCWVGVDRHWTATVSPTLTGNSCHLSQVLATSHFHNSRLNIQNKPWHTVGILLICIEWTERMNE